MRIFVDTASLTEIEEWDKHPWVSGFTTNPTLMRQAGGQTNLQRQAMAWAKRVVQITDKPISIDGPEELWDLGPNVYRKVIESPPANRDSIPSGHLNHTAIVHSGQLTGPYRSDDIISIFAGRIMDTGRKPTPLIGVAKMMGALVLWASVREPYNIIEAEQSGCDIVTVPPVILRKYLDWNRKPLEIVAWETIAQFERDREGLW